ncbi:MAG: sensor histidine kinase, partial [Jatrophihabitans sp.]|uniref:sensor histidine kinase n=1 Tax=Jatrophihabitans sp. TaxID=1932789 RepID=UPI0039132A42
MKGQRLGAVTPDLGRTATMRPAAHVDDSRRHLDHDVLHELSTIALLASLLNSSTELGPESRRRAKQIITEVGWLEKLVRSYESAARDIDDPEVQVREVVQLESLVQSIVTTARAHIDTDITITTTAVGVVADRIALGRALRNLIWNALDAAGPTGHLTVRVTERIGMAAVDIEDDGPGFGNRETTGTCLGLEIVRQVVAAYAGQIEIGRSPLGGCRVRMTLPAVAASSAEDDGIDTFDTAATG